MSFAVSTLTVDPADWTAVVPPVDADTCTIGNQSGAGVLAVRVDEGDADTEFTVEQGAERHIGGVQHFVRGKHVGAYQAPPRFQVGVTAFSVKPASGTGPIVFIWL